MELHEKGGEVPNYLKMILMCQFLCPLVITRSSFHTEPDTIADKSFRSESLLVTSALAGDSTHTRRQSFGPIGQ